MYNTQDYACYSEISSVGLEHGDDNGLQGQGFDPHTGHSLESRI